MVALLIVLSRVIAGTGMSSIYTGRESRGRSEHYTIAAKRQN